MSIRPVLTAVDLEWDGTEPLEVYPERLPDLHAGQAIFVSARLPADGPASVTLRGRTRAGDVNRSLQLDVDAPRQSGVAIRWARAKIRALMDRLHEGDDEDTVRTQVVAVAIDHRLMTRYTSLVAVEEFPSAMEEPTRVAVANGIPARGAALPMGGTSDPLLLRIGMGLVAIGVMILVVGRRVW